MILILASPIESTIDKVIEWIYSFDPNKKVIRINENDTYKILFKGTSIFIEFKDQIINLDEISSYWYRRGSLRYIFKNKIILDDYRNEESLVLEEYINYKLKEKRHISDYFSASVNKFIIIEEAKKVNLMTPNTYIIEDKKTLKKYLKKEELITKTYLESSYFKFENGNMLTYTQEVKNLINIPEKFAPSKFQNKIKKKIELRVFYFRKIMWSMAIFSQNDNQTSLDFRIYNKDKPNRTTPYQLPKQIEHKIISLMENLKLDTGSLDFIVDVNNNYVFLEVNPVGQFGMVSNPCNFNIEEEIAKYLYYEN